MIRELFVQIYLLYFQIWFLFFRIFPIQKKAVFVASFGDNILYVQEELRKQSTEKIIILKDSSCRLDYVEDKQTSVLPFDIRKHPLQFIKAIYHLATCQNVFIDNYFGFLARAKFKNSVNCIQLWHACGAVKRFGLCDPSISSRPTRARERFEKVYQAFSYVVVGSEKMAGIFKESFNLDDKRILRTGIPRTDFFFDSYSMKQARNKLTHQYPSIKDKKVILYAPTFRDHQLTNPELGLELNEIYKKLYKEDYVLLMRWHPAVKASFKNPYPDFIIDVSRYDNINELLVISDILITDYSSIPYEFSLLERPMIFYAYDLAKYNRDRGFWEDYTTTIPGPIVKNTSELLQVILNESYDLDRVRKFAEDWNHYSVGNSSEKLIKHLYK